MTYNFDEVIERRHTDSDKWHRFGDDVLPLWVADMDFRSPEPVIQALHRRVEHGIFGYGSEPKELHEAVVERLKRLYGWDVTPDAVVLLQGVVPGFNLVDRALAEPGDGVLIQTPVYPPILHAHEYAGLVSNQAALMLESDGSYSIDFDVFEQAITERTRIFLLCNPHNPVGRVFRRAELEAMADICLRHDVLICADEIHCDIVYRGYRHVPIASLAPEIAQHTVTLMAPSKTFNIAGLHAAVAIVQNPDLRKRLHPLHRALMGTPSVLGATAALSAYREGQPWLDELLVYLEANRDFLMDYLRRWMPAIRMTRAEATFLAWLDCRAAGAGDCPQGFFLENARVAVNDGGTFGPNGEGFIRLNFGCPRSTLEEALERMRAALHSM